MAPALKTVFSTVIWGVLLAGPVAAIAVVQVPEVWRGRWLPIGVAALTIAFVALLRWAGTASRPRYGSTPDDHRRP